MTKAFERAVRRGDDRLFDDVTLVNQSAKTDSSGDPVRDSHGNIEWASEDRTDVPGEVVYRGTPQFDRRADGVDEDIDIIAFVPDTATATDGGGDEATRATRVERDGKRYVVRDTFDEHNGRIRCHGGLEEH